jgi:hypothetical protein
MSATPPWQTPAPMADQYRAAADAVLARKLAAAPTFLHDKIRAQVADAVKALTGQAAPPSALVVDVEAERAAQQRAWRSKSGERDVAAALSGEEAAWREAEDKARRQRASLPKRDTVSAALAEGYRRKVLADTGAADTPENRAKWARIADEQAAAVRAALSDGRDPSKAARFAKHFHTLAHGADIAAPADVESYAGGAWPTAEDY